MARFQDRTWLWGQSPDKHYSTYHGKENQYEIPGHSRMTAAEGCFYFGIPNICRVRCGGHPQPPYDQEGEVLRPCREVVWSILGAGGKVDDEGTRDIDAVIREAEKHPNVTGGVFDDFFNRTYYYTPEKIREIKQYVNTHAPRPLNMWVVCYEHDFDRVPNLAEYLDVFDVLTFWTWKGSELGRTEENIRRIHEMAPTKRILAGMYLWNYGEPGPLTSEQMIFQADLYLRLMKEGLIEGIVICSNCIADLGIEAVEWTRNWLIEHRDDEI